MTTKTPKPPIYFMSIGRSLLSTAATIPYSPFNLLTWLFAHSPHLRGLFLILGGS
ncbi:hypothetical protein [Nostoc sp. FACHB-888]|uniref:hypothetical protein n=1 Tax=Nostoc sp. FACHB-888 TaxID=2692842 RepID=UPI001684079B|nr:hypothetical protein [Nostoc sp. FACHB-888]MBD2246285.1 hypothetical protein [Nostoc sp. FACHB-888]